LGAGLTISIGDAKATRDLLRRFGVVVFDGAEEGMLAAMVVADNAAQRNLAGRRIQPRSRSLIRSLRHGVRRTSARRPPEGFLGIADGPASAYARVQEVGTVGKGGELPDIRPRKGKALAVPLEGAKDGRGVPIWTGPTDPAIADDLFLIERDGKPPLLARDNDDGTVEPLFVLLKKVAIRPKRYLASAFTENAEEMTRLISGGVTDAIRKKTGGAS